MKSEAMKRAWRICEFVAEKCLEWWEYLLSTVKRERNGWTSNLSEVYRIHSNRRGTPYVEEFLERRKRNMLPNRYKIEIENIDASADKERVGTVSLYRKKQLVSMATLRTKASDSEENKLIYWEFDSNNDK